MYVGSGDLGNEKNSDNDLCGIAGAVRMQVQCIER